MIKIKKAAILSCFFISSLSQGSLKNTLKTTFAVAACSAESTNSFFCHDIQYLASLGASIRTKTFCPPENSYSLQDLFMLHKSESYVPQFKSPTTLALRAPMVPLEPCPIVEVNEYLSKTFEPLCYNALVQLAEKNLYIRQYFDLILYGQDSFTIADIGSATGNTWALLAAFAGKSLKDYKQPVYGTIDVPGPLPAHFLKRVKLINYDINADFFGNVPSIIAKTNPAIANVCEWVERDMTFPPQGKKADFLFFAHPNVRNLPVYKQNSKGDYEIIDYGTNPEEMIKNNLEQYLSNNEKSAALFFLQQEEDLRAAKRLVKECERDFHIVFSGPLELDPEDGILSDIYFKFALFVKPKI